MKIQMALTIEVDPKEWDDDFGCGRASTKVETDVRQYIENTVRWSYAAENGLMVVEVAQ